MSQLDNYIYRVIKILLPSVLLAPFIIGASYYFPFITPRNFFFRIIISIVFALYLYLYFKHRDKYAIVKNKLVISYLAFVVFMTLASLVAGDFWYSFWGNYERMEGLINLYYLLAYLVVFLGVYRSKKSWLEFIRISVFASGLMSIIALSQSMGVNLLISSAGGERVTGTTGNATYLAVYALINFGWAFYLLFKDKRQALKFDLWAFYILNILVVFFEIKSSNRGTLAALFSDFRVLLLFLVPQLFVNLQYYFRNKSHKISSYAYRAYLVFIIILNFLALFNTQTRGVLVGIFVAFLFVTLFFIFSKNTAKKLRQISIAIFIAGLLFSSGIFVFKDSYFIQNNNTLRRVANISPSDATSETRLLTWQLSLEAAKEKPFFGYGEEKFYYVFNKYFPTEIFKNISSRVWFDRPHNVFLQQLVHGGIFTFLAYLAIFYFAFKNLLKYYKKSKDQVSFVILSSILIAYLVQNFFVFDSLNGYILIIPFLAITVFLASDKKALFKKSAKSYLAISSAALILVLGFYLNIPTAMANQNFVAQYNLVKLEIASGRYSQASVDKLLDIINSQYLGKFELRQVYAEMVAGYLQSQALEPAKLGYLIDTAESEMLKTIDEQPDNLRHQSFLTNMYMSAARLDPLYSQKNIDLIENKSLALSPSRTHLYYFLGYSYLGLSNYQKAEENFNKALELSPYVFESYYNLMYFYLSQANIEAAREIENAAIVAVDDFKKEYYTRMAGLYNYFQQADDVNRLLPYIK